MRAGERHDSDRGGRQGSLLGRGHRSERRGLVTRGPLLAEGATRIGSATSEDRPSRGHCENEVDAERLAATVSPRGWILPQHPRHDASRLGDLSETREQSPMRIPLAEHRWRTPVRVTGAGPMAAPVFARLPNLGIGVGVVRSPAAQAVGD